MSNIGAKMRRAFASPFEIPTVFIIQYLIVLIIVAVNIATSRKNVDQYLSFCELLIKVNALPLTISQFHGSKYLQ